MPIAYWPLQQLIGLFDKQNADGISAFAVTGISAFAATDWFV